MFLVGEQRVTKFVDCVHGGGTACKRQGGSGCTVHKAGYIHPFPTSEDLESIAKAVPEDPKVKGDKTFNVPEMEPDIQGNEEAEGMLDVPSMEQDVPKQLYYFDLQNPEGAVRLIELLPILDPDIVEEIYETIWPGYPVQDEEAFNDRVARLEIRGYLMDYLVNNDLKPGDVRPRQTDLVHDFEGEEEDQGPTSESRDEQANATIPDSESTPD